MKRLLQVGLLLLGLAWCVPAHATTAFVRSTSCVQNFSGTTLICTFAAGGTNGNALVWGVYWSDATKTVSAPAVTGCAGTQTILNNPTAGTSAGRAAHGYGVLTSSGTCVLTWTFSANCSTMLCEALAHEISGEDTVNTLDNSCNKLNAQATPGTGTDAVTSTACTTSTSGDYIFGWTVNDGSNSPTITPGTGFTGRVTEATVARVMRSEDQIQGSAGSIAATFTSSANVAYITGMIPISPASATLQSIPWYKLPTVGPSWAISILLGVLIGVGSVQNDFTGSSIRSLARYNTSQAQSLLASPVIELWRQVDGTYQAIPVGTLTKHN